MKRWIFSIVVLAILVVVGVGAVKWYAARGSKANSGFRTAPITRGDLLATINSTGTLEPQEVIDVGAQVAGQILSFGKDTAGKIVDYGSQIEEGTILANIDDSLYIADQQSAKAQLDSAKAGVQRAQADLLQLKAKLVQSQNDWDRAQNLDHPKHYRKPRTINIKRPMKHPRQTSP